MAPIFEIHLIKRDLAAKDFDLHDLAELTDGFTGAEIEQAIVSARYLAASREETLTGQDIAAAINRTYPISVLRADAIESLRTWARSRTVPA